MKVIFIHHLKHRQCFILLLLAVVLMSACTKQKTPEGNPATIFLFNALENGTMVRANLSGSHPIKYITALPVSARSYSKVYSDLAVQPVAFFASADTMPADAPVWSGDLPLERGKIYSLFIVNGSNKGEHVFQEENVPGFKADSVTYMRFANMGNGPAISVNIKGQPNGSLVSGLNFKGISSYAEIPMNSTVNNITYQVRNAATGDLIAEHTTIDMNLYIDGNAFLHRAITLVLTGKPGGTGQDMQRLTPVSYK